MKKAIIVAITIFFLAAVGSLFYYFAFSTKKHEIPSKESDQTTQAPQQITTTTTIESGQQTTTTTSATQLTTLKENEIELSSSGFSKTYVKLAIGTPLIIINKDSKTQNLKFEELEISYVLNADEKLEFPTIEKGKFTIRDAESGGVLTLEVY
jgi:protein-disulfide isomerase